MHLTGNTVLITGGGTGIGRAMAIALHRRGNRVVIVGRRAGPLRDVAEVCPGIEWHCLDVADSEAVRRFAMTAAAGLPELNVLINNAGVMARDAADRPDRDVSTAVVATNLLGPILLTSLLAPTLRHRPGATIVNVTSALAFVPLATAAVYSATKAALHSYTDSVRIALRDSGIQVIEIAPPRVRTEMTGAGASAPVEADEFVAEVIAALAAQPETTEVVVEASRALRYAERTGHYDRVLAALNTADREKAS